MASAKPAKNKKFLIYRWNPDKPGDKPKMQVNNLAFFCESNFSIWGCGGGHFLPSASTTWVWILLKPKVYYIKYCLKITKVNNERVGRKPWSSGYGRRLMFWRSWIWIPVPYTGWTWHFSTLICCKNCIVCLKKTKNKRKRGRGWPIFYKKKWNFAKSGHTAICDCGDRKLSLSQRLWMPKGTFFL